MKLPQGSNSHVILEAVDGFLEDLGYRIRSRLLYSQPTLQLLPTHCEERRERQVVSKVIVNGAAANNTAVNGAAVDRDASHSCTTNGPTLNGFAGEKNGSTAHHDFRGTNGYSETASVHTQGCVNGLLQTVSKPRLLVLSASDKDGILRQARDLRGFLDRAYPSQHHDEILQDISFTLNTSRTMLDWKSYSVLTSLAEVSDLEASLSAPIRKSSEGRARLALVFTGQGAQWPRMGYELLGWPVFRASLEHSQQILNSLGCTWSILGKLARAMRSSR